jgi:predicted peptidase
VIAPLTTSRGWELDTLMMFLNAMEERFAVDPAKVFLTGMGDGADMVWMMGVFYPQRFAAIAPVAGTGEPKFAKENLMDMPIWIFHGKQDEVVPAERSLIMVGALKDQHKHLNYTLYPELGHDIGLEVYNQPLLYHWFLQDTQPDHQN